MEIKRFDRMREHDEGNESPVVKRLVTRQCEALQRAGALYQVARFAGQISRLLSWLAGRPDQLMEASEILPDRTGTHQDSSLQSVAIRSIMASERRSQDFDRAVLVTVLGEIPGQVTALNELHSPKCHVAGADLWGGTGFAWPGFGCDGAGIRMSPGLPGCLSDRHPHCIAGGVPVS